MKRLLTGDSAPECWILFRIDGLKSIGLQEIEVEKPVISTYIPTFRPFSSAGYAKIVNKLSQIIADQQLVLAFS
jgi:hypothetical protein